ncbi:MAG: methionine--tRNA ligase subunit beta [Thermoprotei archaeon]|nr:MAG: methionine--tRNA ligase subunit beta [Thermoprotei archaeon]
MQENYITIEDFSKIDLRVGVVKEVEKIPDTRKLLRLIVDLGELGERQLVAGLGDVYSPEDLLGKRIVVVVNLKPKAFRGYLSQGMLLAAGCGKGEVPRILTVDGDVKPGSKVC